MLNLKEWRNRLGLPQSKAAKVLGINLRTYKRYEAGDIPPGITEILRLACLAVERLP